MTKAERSETLRTADRWPGAAARLIRADDPEIVNPADLALIVDHGVVPAETPVV